LINGDAGGEVRLTAMPGIVPKIIGGWLLVGVHIWSYHLLILRMHQRQPPYLRLTAYALLRVIGWMLLTWMVFALIDRRPAVRMTLAAAVLKVIPLMTIATLAELVTGATAMALAWPRSPMTFSEAFLYGLTTTFHDSLIWIFTIIAVGHGIRFHYAKATLARAQFATLSSRMQPHFLFNALNSIAALVRSDAAGAETMISRLGDLLRASMSAGQSEMITVAEELRFVEQYLAIQRIRYADRMCVRVSAAPEAESLLVPRFILQPLVENAVKHGIEPLETPGCVAVDARVDHGRLHLTVRNSAPPDLPPLGTHEGLGLRHTRARLELLYGSEQALHMERCDDGSIAAQIALPAKANVAS
jgi:hypothetical protein